MDIQLDASSGTLFKSVTEKSSMQKRLEGKSDAYYGMENTGVAYLRRIHRDPLFPQKPP